MSNKNDKPQPSPSTSSKDKSDSSSNPPSPEQVTISNSSDEDSIEKDATKLTKKLLNFKSSKFNPFLALSLSTSEGESLVPVPDAPKYLNLFQYDKAVSLPSQLPKANLQLKSIKKKLPSTTDKGTSTTSDTDPPGPGPSQQQFPIPGRRFLAHQLPVHKPRVEAHHTIDIMENIEGPLSALRVAMKEKKRIKIWTRSATGIRGYITGFIEAFDKHWNIALRDVDESCQRKRAVKQFIEVDPVLVPSDTHLGQRSSLQSKENHQSNSKASSKIKPKVVSSQSQYVPLIGSSKDLLTLLRIGLSNLSLEDSDTSGSRNSRRPGKVVRYLMQSAAETQNQTQTLTSSSRRKKEVTIFKKPFKDPNGFTVVAQSKKFEIVERHVGQLFLMGNDIAFIETMTR